jgi:hypothetical protein
MEMKTILTNIAKIIAPILLGGAILYWMYRGEDFIRLRHVLLEEMDWTWMLLSFPFGILAQLFRGWRWKQTLEPIARDNSRKEEGGTRNENSSSADLSDNNPVTEQQEDGNLLPPSSFLLPRIRSSVCIYAVFLSYATSLIIPRLGEFTRCGVLKRFDGCSFSKALGTVVTERAIDTLLMGTVAGLTLLFQLSVFGTFFTQTGTSLDTILERFSLTGYLVTAVCIIAILILLHILFQSLNIYSKVKATASGIWQGVISLKDVKNLPLFIFFTLGIWVSYFLHYYLTFFCFEATSHLGLACALVTFVVGSIAVIVPTPNGAGPWHFAVKTMLILYGVVDEYALYFVLIVHTVQTMLVVVLGIYAWAALSFTKRISRNEEGGTRNEITPASD